MMDAPPPPEPELGRCARRRLERAKRNEARKAAKREAQPARAPARRPLCATERAEFTPDERAWLEARRGEAGDDGAGDAPYAILLFYAYVGAADAAAAGGAAYEPGGMLAWQRATCTRLRVEGRARVAPEGLNCNLSGAADAVRAYCRALRREWAPLFDATDFKLAGVADERSLFRGAQAWRARALVALGDDAAAGAPAAGECAGGDAADADAAAAEALRCAGRAALAPAARSAVDRFDPYSPPPSALAARANGSLPADVHAALRVVALHALLPVTSEQWTDVCDARAVAATCRDAGVGRGGDHARLLARHVKRLVDLLARRHAEAEARRALARRAWEARAEAGAAGGYGAGLMPPDDEDWA